MSKHNFYILNYASRYLKIDRIYKNLIIKISCLGILFCNCFLSVLIKIVFMLQSLGDFDVFII